MDRLKQMYILPPDSYELIKLGQKMIHQHNPTGLVGGYISKDNSATEMQVNTEGYIQLSSYFDRNIVDPQQFSLILQGLLKPLLEMDKYYLNIKYISFDLSDILMHTQDQTIGYIYGSNEGVGQVDVDAEVQIKNFLKLIIYEKVRLTHPNCKLVADILSYLNEPGWHIKGLLYLLEQDESGEENPNVGSNKEEIPSNRINLPSRSPVQYDKEGTHTDFIQSTKKNKGLFRTFPKGQVVISGLVLLFGGLLYTIRSLKISSTEKLGLIIIVFAFITYFGVKRVKRRKQHESYSKEENRNQEGVKLKQSLKVKNKTEIFRNNSNIHKNVTGVEPHLEPNVKERFVVKKSSDSELVERQKHYQTVVKRQVSDNYMLVGAGGQTMILNKDILVMGRQEDLVDLLISDNSSVGRQHAQFIKIESGYAIKDLKSVNGTFVNNVKVLPDQAIALQTGDTLRLSDVSFTFKSMIG